MKTINEYYEEAKNTYQSLSNKPNLTKEEQNELDQAKRYIDYIKLTATDEEMLRKIALDNKDIITKKVESANKKIDSVIFALDQKINQLEEEKEQLSKKKENLQSQTVDNKHPQKLENDMGLLRKRLLKIDTLLQELEKEKISAIQTSENNSILISELESEPEKLSETIIAKKIGNPEDIMNDMRKYEIRNLSSTIVHTPQQHISRSGGKSIIENGQVNRPLVNLIIDYTTGSNTSALNQLSKISSIEERIRYYQFCIKSLQDYKKQTAEYIEKTDELGHQREELIQQQATITGMERIFNRKKVESLQRDSSKASTEIYNYKNKFNVQTEACLSNIYGPTNYTSHYYPEEVAEYFKKINYAPYNSQEEREEAISKVAQHVINQYSNDPNQFNEYIENNINTLKGKIEIENRRIKEIESTLPDEYKGYSYDDISSITYHYMQDRTVWRKNPENVWKTTEELPPEDRSPDQLAWRDYIRYLYELSVIDDFKKAKKDEKVNPLTESDKKELAEIIGDTLQSKIQTPEQSRHI